MFTPYKDGFVVLEGAPAILGGRLANSKRAEFCIFLWPSLSNIRIGIFGIAGEICLDARSYPVTMRALRAIQHLEPGSRIYVSGHLSEHQLSSEFSILHFHDVAVDLSEGKRSAYAASYEASDVDELREACLQAP